MGRKGKGMAQPSMQRLQRDCTRFFHDLWAGDARPLVFGDGCEKGPVLMLIGEAPGEQEALQGKPFVGRAGKNLDAFLQVVGLARSDVYLSNVVKIRPSKRSPAGRVVNRPPTKEEVELFLPWLMKEIALVKPMALVTLGNVALHAFLPKGRTIGECHGQWHQAVVRPPRGEAVTLPLFALYHPASVIYRAGLQEEYQRDMERLRDSLRLSKTQAPTFGE
jgi:DNA polymerase